MAVNRHSRLVDGEMIERAGFSWRMIDNVGRLRLYEPVLVNTDESGGPGIHWLLYHKLPRNVFVYDPLGPANRADYVGGQPPHGAVWFHGKTQTDDSVLCGYYALHIAELFREYRPKTIAECQKIIEHEYGRTADMGDVKHLMNKSKLI